MSRPKNIDATLLALKAKLMEFDREHGITRGDGVEVISATTVRVFIEDLKGIFFGNSKMVAPFYLDKLRELEEELTYVKPSQFERLAKDAALRSAEEPESVKKVREMAIERKQGIFRCLKCANVVDVEDSNVLWNKDIGAYEHTTDCIPEKIAL